MGRGDRTPLLFLQLNQTASNTLPRELANERAGRTLAYTKVAALGLINLLAVGSRGGCGYPDQLPPHKEALWQSKQQVATDQNPL